MNIKNRLRVRVSTAAATALLGLSLAGSGYAQDSDPIKIGFAISESGWLSNYDGPPFKAAVLRIEEINEAGGLLGRQIEYEVVDTRTNSARSATAGATLVNKGVDLLAVSCDYDFGAPAALAGDRAGIISFSLCAADPKMGVQGVGPYTFTATSAAQSEGIAMAEYAQKEMGIETVYVLEDTTIEYTKSACAGFRAAWKQGAGEQSILGNDTFKNDDPSIGSQVNRIQGLEETPDAIYMCSITPGGASATRQIRAAGIDVPILANTAMVGNYWLNAVEGLENFYVPALISIYGDDPRDEVNTFLDSFKARWDGPPASSYSVLGYTLIEQWEYAVSEAGTTDSDSVLEVLNQLDDHPFTAGPTSYSDQLHIQVDRPWLMMEVSDGSFRAMEIYRNSMTPDMQLLFRVGQ